MIMGTLLFFYYLAISAGVCLSGSAFLHRLRLFNNLPQWVLILLSFGLWPAFLSWTGSVGLYQAIYVVQYIGALFAVYFTFRCYRNYHQISDAIRKWFCSPDGRIYRYSMTVLGLVFLLAQLLPQYCYLLGGVNNWPFDQVRGLSFTSAFAANYLKPAYPLDLSIPISYGYYLYEYTAFLYSSVNGYSWPSITLMVGSLASTTAFYFVFLKFIRLFLPIHEKPYLGLFAVCAVTFYGLDIFVNPKASADYHIEWWNNVQITQMASYWNWAYHYLAGAAYSMAGMVCLHDALIQRRRDFLLAAAMLLCLGPTFAPVTGVFFICVGGLTLSLFLAARYRTGLPRWFLFQTLTLFPAILGSIVFILLPQVFTFFGRGGYLQLLTSPVFWFNRLPMATAPGIQWAIFGSTMLCELGPMLFIGLLATPFYIQRTRKQSSFASIAIFSLFIAIFASECLVTAQTNDWYWRSGAFGIILLSTIVATWVFEAWMPANVSHRPAYVLLMLLLLAPCVFNFYSELHFRYEKCDQPARFLIGVNDNIDLHDTVAYVSFDSSLIYFAGRIIVNKDNPTKLHLGFYSLPQEFLVHRFQYRGATVPCRSTWFGTSTPRPQGPHPLHIPNVVLSYCN